MFDKNLLKAELVYNNYTFEKLAKSLDLTKGTISKKMNGSSEWTLSEIQKIGEIVGKKKLISIFFE